MKNKIRNFYKLLPTIFLITLSIVVIITAIYSLRYVFLGADGIMFLADTDDLLGLISHQKSDFWHNFALRQKPIYHKNETILLAHIIGVSIAFIAGIFQLSPSVRKQSITIHRNIGYLYIISAVIGLSFGGYISFALPMVGGLLAIIPNIIGSSLGIFFILIALICLWKKQYLTHGKWMLRSYAILFTLLTLYFLIGFFALCRLPADIGYKIAHLTCLPINLIIVEIIINKKRLYAVFK